MASKACCSVPPITAVKDYKTRGDYTTIDGLKTCKNNLDTSFAL